MRGEYALVRFGPPPSADARVSATIQRRDGRLALRYHLRSGRAPIVVPPRAGHPARREGLWEHTCCEAFVSIVGAAAYWEINLAPSGDWNVYCFDGYRHGMRCGADSDVAGACEGDAESGWVVSATVDLGRPGVRVGAAIDVGLTTVLEHGDGSRSYWALTHGAPQPDFHHRQSFTLTLPADGSCA